MSERSERIKDHLLAIAEGNSLGTIDLDLQQEINTLVQAAEATPRLIDQSAWSFQSPQPATLPNQIGQYQILGELGSGGMGVVYRAQKPNLGRQVAIKVIRPELVFKSGIDRFAVEGAALARLCHPNIAQIFDTGKCQNEQPFIVMELVDGIPITEYVQKNRLSLEQRIRLFLEVCEGINHAHRRGVIHRDLKPNNILVTERDGQPRPKIIDFGIAKVLNQGLGRRLTATDQVLGTLEYLSPEVIENGAAEADTRSDIYALGSVLYEILTGVPPVCLDDFRELGFMQIFKSVQEAPHVRVSDKLVLQIQSRERVSAPDPSTQHNSLPYKPGNIGDLNCIVQHALEKEPDSRYQSVESLSEDLERFLSRKSILASPPSTFKKCLRFLARHWLMTLSISLMVLLGSAAAWTTYQSQRKVQQSQLQAQQSVAEKQIAKQESERTITFFRDALLGQKGQDQQAKQRLVLLGQKLDEFLSTSSHLSWQNRFELTMLLGHAYSATGDAPRAERLLLQAHEMAQEDEATPTARFSIAFELAEHLSKSGDSKKAVQFAREAEKLAREEGDKRRQASAKYVLANALTTDGKLAQASRLYQSILEQKEPIANKDPELARARAQVMYATVLVQLRKPKQAIQYGRMGYEAFKRELGMINPRTLMAGHNLATILGIIHQDEEALDIYREILPARVKALGEDHPDTLMTRTMMAKNLADVGQVNEAEALYAEAIRLGDRKYRDKNPIGGLASAGLAKIKMERSEFDSAIELSKKMVRYATSKYGQSWKVEIYRSRLAKAYLAASQPDLAAPLATQAYQILSRETSPSHVYSRRAAESAAEAFRVMGDEASAKLWTAKARPGE